MLARSTVGRSARRALRCQCQLGTVPLGGRRGLAAPASGSFSYETGDAAGIKVASRDMAGATTTLALVAKAGTRYQSLPGLSEALEKYAFKGTEKRSALRIQREVELLGAELQSYHTRENLVIGAKFLRDDLPYFVELLSEVVTQTKFSPHYIDEELNRLMSISHKSHLANTESMALDSVHGIAFHRGLGHPLKPTTSLPYSQYISVETLSAFNDAAYSKGNFAIVANGAASGELAKWVGEYFGEAPTISYKLESGQSKYYGGEERIAHGGGNTMIIGFPGSSSLTGGFYKPEISVLAALLGGKSTIKWSPGFSLLGKAGASIPGVKAATKSAIYSDAGILYSVMSGNADGVAALAEETVKAVKAIAAGEIPKEDIAKAVALAKFKELDFGQNVQNGLELTGSGLIQQGKPYQVDDSAAAIGAVTEEQVVQAAKTLLENKASVSTVGDLFRLPFGEDLGLKV
ncbi:ubiquinol-cytochrome C reductase complex core protein-like protein 2 [Lineolata rhizophorae]|uniref:Cytochrome b-c1 complex subunit 2, mitochondrial n=1 Tax=Lineolata rhizophorae TaxID=578093 RepID=A0A6A6NRR4_9PEZI|nr:ubiquinol-cytochrome C reductase complex core protein-like protein 2 [Lineolata rhizophorae]